MISAPNSKESLKIDLSTLTQLTKRPTGYVNHTRDSYQLKCLKCSFWEGGGRGEGGGYNYACSKAKVAGSLKRTWHIS